jgi:AraC-like DNA-binding protein
MEILGQTPVQSILFFTLYGISGAVPLLAALYLLLRPCNVFSADIKPPMRLRRWAASFFVFSALTHVWWLLFFIFSRDQQSVVYQLIILTDCVLLLTTVAGTMLSMLQDRRRPVWPVMLAMLPFVLLTCAYMANPSNLLKQMVMIYLLLLSALFTVYMVFAIRRYDRWLNDNYADLEHKRVWLSQVVAFLCMLLFVLYVVAEDMVLIYCLHIVDLVLIFLLLWRVETLPQLDAAPAEEAHTPQAPDRLVSTASAESAFVPDTMPIMPTQPEQPLADPINIDVDQMEQLLKEHCEATRLYLENDLTLQMLAQAMGTNRSYLSQYFSRQGVTYNTYINGLRINHFISRCRELSAAGQDIPIQQLALESGFGSYRTFSRAFLQRTGKSVTVWMNGGNV